MTDTTTEHNVRQTAVDRAMRMLDAAGAEYAIEFAGQTYGTLKVAPKPKRAAIYPRGATRAHYLPLMENLQPGESVIVPSNGFDLSVLAKNISAYAANTWGRGECMTVTNRDRDCIEVLRL